MKGWLAGIVTGNHWGRCLEPAQVGAYMQVGWGAVWQVWWVKGKARGAGI